VSIERFRRYQVFCIFLFDRRHQLICFSTRTGFPGNVGFSAEYSHHWPKSRRCCGATYLSHWNMLVLDFLVTFGCSIEILIWLRKMVDGCNRFVSLKRQLLVKERRYSITKLMIRG
jgi:hypothetical protein